MGYTWVSWVGFGENIQNTNFSGSVIRNFPFLNASFRKSLLITWMSRDGSGGING